MPEKITNQRCSDAYLNDMARYSIVNNYRRSIPDYRDGLKPVQRRIIFSMDKNNHALTEKTKMKSAKIYGVVMGDYHPHCLHGDTLVCNEEDGTFMTMEEACNINARLQISSIDTDGKIVTAEAYDFRVGQYADKIYKIYFSDKLYVTCTGNHAFLTKYLTWIEAKDICKGMILARYNESEHMIEQEVTHVEVSTLETAIAMYDFTVDTYNNMLIPVFNEDVDGDDIWICAHNSDSSIYDAMKPMANWFECKMPLINPFGNFGTIMGDGAASGRYTEAWLSQFAQECVIAGLHTSDAVVDWTDNYDNTSKEPEYLPAIVPLLLVNGTNGIGVGVKVDVPTHNLGEVIDATVRLIDNPNADVVLIPDHCIPCEIIDTNWKSICNTGNGKYKARGYVEKGFNAKGNPVLTITSLPVYNTGNVFSQILKLVGDGKLPQVIDVDDESKTKKIKISIVLKKGSDADYVKEALYKYTDLEKSFSVNFEVINGIELIRMSYKSYLESFILFAKQNKFRYCCSILNDINTRSHRIEAFIKVLESGYINDIIKMIQKRKTIDDNEIIEFLIKKIKITDLQASYIINASIKQLSLGYLNKYKDEYAKLMSRMEELEKMVMNDDLISDSVRNDLIEIKKKYATPRISKVIKVSDAGNIPQGIFTLVITENNYVRKLGANDIVNTIRGDSPKFILQVDNIESVILFDNKGRVFKLPVHKLPIVGKSDPGIDIRTILKGLTADIIRVIQEPVLKRAANLKNKFYVAVLTKGNTIKKLDVNDFLSVPPSGIIYSKLNMDDSVIAVDIVSDQLDIVVYSGHKALRIAAKDIPCYKRNTLGVAVMNTNDPMEGMSIIYPEATDIVVITRSGKLNRFMASGLNRSTRNKAGSSVIKIGKSDCIHSIYGVNEKNTLNITTTSEVIAIPVASIERGSSVSSGIKAVSTKSDIILKADVI